MNEKNLTYAVLIGVLVVGMIGISGITNTGAVVKNTGVLPSSGCDCEITSFDYSGNPIGKEIHFIRTRSRAAATPGECTNRCQTYYKTTKWKSVVGWPATN